MAESLTLKRIQEIVALEGTFTRSTDALNRHKFIYTDTPSEYVKYYTVDVDVDSEQVCIQTTFYDDSYDTYTHTFRNFVQSGLLKDFQYILTKNPSWVFTPYQLKPYDHRFNGLVQWLTV